MDLESLVKKAKNSTWWKWFFAVFITLGVLFLLWVLWRKNNELKRLRVEKRLAEENAKDLAAQAEIEENQTFADALREEAKRAVIRVAELDTQIKNLESEIAKTKKKVDDAKSWKELEE